MTREICPLYVDVMFGLCYDFEYKVDINPQQVKTLSLAFFVAN